jgi:hypothetical protein
MTDTRHDSTCNAYHTTVPCLSGRYMHAHNACMSYVASLWKTISNHKIVGLVTLSRKNHAVAQTREVECTRIVLSQVMNRGMCVM